MPTPLDQLKSWLAITTNTQDDALQALIATALDVCDGFTGRTFRTADWADLPQAVRHGAIRLAAHLYRERDDPADAAVPPAAVAALWRPWRRMRLT